MNEEIALTSLVEDNSYQTPLWDPGRGKKNMSINGRKKNQCISPSTCHPSRSWGLNRFPSFSSVPRFTMKESLHDLLFSVTLSSPPTRSQMASQALGAKSATFSCRCRGMLVLSRVQVDLSVGDIPNRSQTSRVHSSAASVVKHPSSFTNPCVRKCSTSADDSTLYFFSPLVLAMVLVSNLWLLLFVVASKG